ncbi:zinc transporter 2-like isoform X2 [Coccinella septempunctata]|uniref:zinc transporter 2-like isoform X2 n=1 Tax=Coccinella septempunctata TaxID=41139 RepID=UPI001D05E9CF|nr:zinc transporter 2-like isoform X2 [Coccinella septempunctata]XP_044764676.1 zinc transporter 2-like isoform X2 [Coccinella septempunctata]
MSGTENNQANYGTLQRPSVGSTKTIIYCVHGNPSTGCCKVLQSEVMNLDSTVAVDNLNTNTKENYHTTELLKKHCHRDYESGIDKKARNRLLVASALCLVFMLAEIIGGYLSNSLAIASDAAHLLTDFASFMISLFSLWVASRPSTKSMHFGWYRAEVIGALTSVLMIWVVTAILVYIAFLRLINNDFEIDTKIMLITSGLGVVVNLIMGLSLHDHGHGHSHSGNHSHKTNPDDDKKQNINVRAALIHVIGDFLQSLGVFIAAIVIFFKEEWKIMDPICTFLFSILVVITTFNIIKDVIVVLMEGAPRGIDFKEVINTLMDTPGVKRVHNVRIWALSLDKIAMSAHIAINQGTDPQTILMTTTKNIQDRYNFFEMTLQIEEFQEIMENCCQCKNPV